ncbi:MAG: hypothetical protein PUI92_03155 [Firmicutes bacterium]|nr:hypothetical protein [Bacillota bacterium]MDY6173651.1 hypothetical protein [Lentihominibacter sp.]
MVNRGTIIDMVKGIEEMGEVPRPAFVIIAIPRESRKTPGIMMI